MTKARDLSLAAKAPLASPTFTGNVGLGVTPESTSASKLLQLGTTGTLSWFDQGDDELDISINSVHNSGYKYITTNEASLYTQYAGTHLFKVAPSGSADAAISWIDAMTINNAGIVTQPLQPAFSAQAVATNNFGVGAWHTMNCTEIFDNNADFNPSTNKFTAPVTGRYQLNLTLRLDNLQTNASYFYVNIQTSNRQNYNIMATDGYDAAVPYFGISTSVLADMDAGDTANVNYYIASGSSVSDIHNETRFTGFLAC